MSRLPDSLHPKIVEAHTILVAVGMPAGQQNERTALVVLALAGIGKSSVWAKANSSIRLGITEMMDWMRHAYGKQYAPNSRETVRRHSVHQLITAGLVQ